MAKIERNVVDADGNKWRVRRSGKDGVVISPRGATKTVSADVFAKTFKADTSKAVRRTLRPTKTDKHGGPSPAVKAQP